MSNIFLKNELGGIFDTITESNVSLPQWVTIVDKANSVKGTEPTQPASATSSAFAGQLGGAYSVTSANSSRDVNKLISMLTSESSSSNFKGLSETSTASLEEQLREILNQDGGAKKYKKGKKSQKGGAECDVEGVKQFFANLKNTGVNVDIKLNDKTLSEFFATQAPATQTAQPLDATTTVIPSETSENDMTDMSNWNKLNASTTSENQVMLGVNRMTDGQVGGKKKGSKKGSKKSAKKGGADDSKLQSGGKKKGSKKSSKKSSKKGSKKNAEGGMNPGFQAFLDLKKYIAEKLGVSNGPIAAKVAGAVQKDMKEKHPDMDAVSLAAEGRKHFDKNMDHYKQMIPK